MKRKLALIGLVAIMLSNTAFAGGNLKTFEDTRHHWSRDYVSHLYNEGIVQGYPNSNRFGVNDGINREQASAIISRKIGGSSASISHGFRDVNGWSEEPIAHLASLGLVQGVNGAGDIFEPTRSMTRAEFATMMSRFLKVSNYRSDKSVNASFTDTSGHWAEGEILEVARLGLIQGTNGRFNPNSNITRGEVSAIIARMDGVVAQVPEKPLHTIQKDGRSIGAYESREVAIREAKKHPYSEVTYDGRVIWSDAAARVRQYIIHDQWEWGASNATGCLWDPLFLNSLSDQVISGLYKDHVSSGGSRYDIKDFAWYLTENAPIQSNWQDMYSRTRAKYYPNSSNIIGFEHISDSSYYNGAHYSVYIEGYPPGLSVSLNARTGWARG